MKNSVLFAIFISFPLLTTILVQLVVLHLFGLQAKSLHIEIVFLLLFKIFSFIVGKTLPILIRKPTFFTHFFFI
ncbi:hypothetical protein SAMN02745116_01495 [Pilibacter termitis]|uniref:Uncharacterized protein n=1 Tax=Pilibacter termitis TaxID=263852 RepID=A0A1T4NPQ2_9ENTE|nr:hypothetical protein SAMN02745116_01495 [Pilibacter termitis]